MVKFPEWKALGNEVDPAVAKFHPTNVFRVKLEYRMDDMFNKMITRRIGKSQIQTTSGVGFDGDEGKVESSCTFTGEEPL